MNGAMEKKVGEPGRSETPHRPTLFTDEPTLDEMVCLTQCLAAGRSSTAQPASREALLISKPASSHPLVHCCLVGCC